MASKVDFIKARLQAVTSVLEKTSPKEREGSVSTHLADEFNGIVKEIGEAFPDAAPHLPKPIASSTPFSKLGKSDVHYVDLMVMVEQVLRVVSVVESHG